MISQNLLAFRILFAVSCLLCCLSRNTTELLVASWVLSAIGGSGMQSERCTSILVDRKVTDMTSPR